MRDLKKQSGLPIVFDGNAIHFKKGVFSNPMQIRTIEDARPFLADNKATATRKKLYAMYRDVRDHNDEAIFLTHRARFDITIIFPGTIGGKHGEYIRTIGHTHPAPEIYEVLDGDAMFILQQFGKRNNNVIYISAKTGDKIFIPLGYGHSTVNTGTKPLILADLFANFISSDYKPFKQSKGPAFRVLTGSKKQEMYVLEKNKFAKHIGMITIGTPTDLSTIGIDRHTPLYTLFTTKPKQFAFLTNKKEAAAIAKEIPLCNVVWKGKLTSQ